jgi:hypothetical protein
MTETGETEILRTNHGTTTAVFKDDFKDDRYKLESYLKIKLVPRSKHPSISYQNQPVNAI